MVRQMHAFLSESLRAPSPPGPADAAPSTRRPATLSTLPTELVLAVIQSAVPLASFGPDWPVRASQLRTCALVNRHWRQLAQSELWEHPVIQRDKAGDRLCLAVGGSPDGARLVRTLRIEGERLRCTHDGRVAELVKHCVNVREIWLRRLTDLRLDTFIFAPDLRWLHLFSCEVREALHVPHKQSKLVDLRMFHCTVSSSAIVPVQLPHLATFAYDNPDPEPTPWQSPFAPLHLLDIIPALGLQLRALLLPGELVDELASTFARLPALALLYLTSLGLLPIAALAALPHKLHRLHLGPSTLVPEAFAISRSPPRVAIVVQARDTDACRWDAAANTAKSVGIEWIDDECVDPEDLALLHEGFEVSVQAVRRETAAW